MESYSRILESLSVSFRSANVTRVKEPFGVKNYYEIDSTFIYVERGCLYYGEEQAPVRTGEVLFVPDGQRLRLCFGDFKVPPERFLGDNYHDQVKSMSLSEGAESSGSTDIFLSVHMEAKVFNAVNLFVSLDVLPFVIKENPKLISILKEIEEETEGDAIGRIHLLECKCKELVTHLLRHIIHRQLFVQQITTNSNNLRDDRLIVLFRYINDNLASDLSNKCLAIQANVSEDYVGQYFKTLTGINPQDYIEFQRMHRSIALLRSTKKSVREIGKEVGYKDSSYFCRRFKMMFGISAGHMRRRESVRAVTK